MHAALRFALLASLLGLTHLPAYGRDRVALQARAQSEYVRERLSSGAPRVETYVFSPGHFLPGATRDRSLSSTTFDAIARTLARDLAKQNYHPAKGLDDADLVIVVHWGATIVDETSKAQEPLMQMSAALAASGAMDANQAAEMRFLELQRMTDQLSTQGYMRRNAELLGYDHDLALEQRSARINASNYELTLLGDLDEERYFVILMAWDARALRQQQKRLLWSTRFSVRSPGINFHEALPTMSRFAADFFGTDAPTLHREAVTRRRSSVEVGEATVVESDAPNPR